MIEDRLKEFSPGLQLRLRRSPVYPEPSFDEGAYQPRPDGPLVICAVAFAHAALVMWRVSGLGRRERAQAERRPEPRLDGGYDLIGSISIDESDRQAADSEDLIGAERRIDSAGLVIAIDDIVQIAALFIPKTRRKRLTAFFECRFPPLRKSAADP